MWRQIMGLDLGVVWQSFCLKGPCDVPNVKRGFAMRWWRQGGSWLGLVGLVTLAVTGCGHAISETLRRQAEPPIAFAQLQANPEAYKDRLVILGGEILLTRNVQEGTLLQVLHKPLNRYEQPRLTDRTEGRFMALCATYLDAAIYTKGREITVAGRVLGARKEQVGEIEYTYPLVSCLELHLWARPVQQPAPYPWWYRDPWYWWDPWYWRPYRYPWWGPWYPYW